MGVAVVAEVFHSSVMASAAVEAFHKIVKAPAETVGVFRSSGKVFAAAEVFHNFERVAEGLLLSARTAVIAGKTVLVRMK
ncbi:hypothetical protein E2C01_032436 [Portunus trituberculatus]|uniref:Uncharacterized protein n=1 Tax=Portunus trituberculatus TaxID=210409 RepID=A0A5B7F0X8_PORTR|nr:hypothetical protein [Portunus trituberculatus]